jgi:hypothetical protein
MQSPMFNELVQPMETVRRIIWLAFTGAIAVYIFITYVSFGWPASSLDPLLSNPLTIPLTVVSFVTAIASRWIPGLLLSDRQVRELLSRQPDPDALAAYPQIGRIDADRLAKIKGLPPGEQRLLSLVGPSFVPFLVRLAANESIALYGLVLGFLSQSLLPVLPFAIVAIGFQLTVPPKLDSDLERAARLRLY